MQREKENVKKENTKEKKAPSSRVVMEAREERNMATPLEGVDLFFPFSFFFLCRLFMLLLGLDAVDDSAVDTMVDF